MQYKDEYMSLVHQMHQKFGFHEVANNMSPEKFEDFLLFRQSQIAEEVGELKEAIEANDAEEILDALIDILVFTFGTLDFITTKRETLTAYREVMLANISKEAGVKPERPNPYGFPDLLKPEGWKPPNNTGISVKLQERLNAKK